MTEEVEQWFFLNKTPTPIAISGTRMTEEDKWYSPEIGVIKCNVHPKWRNTFLHSGVAWITRDHLGNVMHYARDAFVYMPNRVVAELRCMIWALRSLRDLHISKVIITLDYHEIMEAITAPQQWPRFRDLLEQVKRLRDGFKSLTFECVKTSSNEIVRDIAKSVLRDIRYQSYLALGGPAWLHDRILRDTVGNDV